jgi:hypothetical protein
LQHFGNGKPGRSIGECRMNACRMADIDAGTYKVTDDNTFSQNFDSWN